MTTSGALENQGRSPLLDARHQRDLRAGGTISGPGYLLQLRPLCHRQPGDADDHPLRGDGDTLETDNLPNTTLWVQGNGYHRTRRDLDVADGLTNDGTILLESQNANYSDTLATGSGTFTNAADGTIQVAAGLGRRLATSPARWSTGQIDVGPARP